MIIRDKNGTERIAMAYDFQDVTITFTPAEWKELLDIFSCHKKKIQPDAFAKIKHLLKKLDELTGKQAKSSIETAGEDLQNVISGCTGRQ